MPVIHLGFLEKAIKGGAMAVTKGMAKKEMANMRKSIKAIPDPVERQKQMESLEVAEKIMDFKLKYSIPSKLCHCFVAVSGTEVNVDTVTRLCHTWTNGLLHGDVPEFVPEIFCLMFFDYNYLAVREDLDLETLDILRKAEDAFLTREYVVKCCESYR